MESVTVWRGAAYRHRQPRLGPVACPTCGTGRVAFRQWCRRLVEYPGPEQPAYLVLRCPSTPARTLPASAGTSPRRSPRRPPAPALQRTATRQYRRGTAALQAVWPHAERQLCWFLVMHWLTHTLARLLRDYCETLPEAERQDLTRLRFRLLACPDWQMRLGERERAALARAWELVRGTVVEDALLLRDDLWAVLNTSTSRAEARERFDALRATWPASCQPWAWRPGQPLPEPHACATEGVAGVAGYLEQIRAYFVRYFEQLIN